MAPKWHAQARRLKKAGKSLAEIGRQLEVSPQSVSIALDPKKQERRRAYVKAWKAKRYAEDEFRARQQKLDRESKQRQRAAD